MVGDYGSPKDIAELRDGLREIGPTPGPWGLRSGNPCDVESPEHGQIAACETEGDAIFITAAPDMFACLKWLQPYAEVQIRNHPDSNDTPKWRSIIAAIAKAEGTSWT